MPPKSFLDELPPEEHRRVLVEARRRRFRKNEVIFHEGDPGESLHIVTKGHVAIRSSTPLGDVATFTVLGPGDVFGEQALVNADNTRTASAVALEATETQSISRPTFEALRAQHPTIDRFLVYALADQVRRLSNQLTEALFVPADKRVVRHVARLARSYAGDEPMTVIPLTQDDLASLAGTTRPTANRILKALEGDGIIRLGRGRIEVLRPADLEHRAR